MLRMIRRNAEAMTRGILVCLKMLFMILSYLRNRSWRLGAAAGLL